MANQVAMSIDMPGALFPLHIDSSGIVVCAPSQKYAQFFSGHHRSYEMRFLHIVGADGICHASFGLHDINN